VLRRPEVAALASRVSPALLAGWVREALAEIRTGLREGSRGARPLEDAASTVLARLEANAAALDRPPLRRVINATGVVVHTNLGRAPLAAEAVAAAQAAGSSYVDLEYDLERGERGSRGSHLKLAADALFPGHGLLAVNNNAAAVLLVLNTLADGREAVVSRGELVEIGGSFRFRGMAKAGAILREVGTRTARGSGTIATFCRRRPPCW
jgi:L-seryl-tRNA(Ser) seleniumtransferase